MLSEEFVATKTKFEEVMDIISEQVQPQEFIEGLTREQVEIIKEIYREKHRED